MMSRFAPTLLLLVIVLTTGCAALRDDDLDDLVERLDEIVEDSWDDRDSTDELIESLGPPEHKDVEKISNRYDANQIDEIWTLTYPGLVAKFYKVRSEDPKDLLIGLWVADARYEVGPYFKIGTSRTRIERLFENTCDRLTRQQWMLATKSAEVTCDDDDACALGCGPASSQVFFKFTGQRVDRIDWDYFWE
jgi:hypothetical protein